MRLSERTVLASLHVKAWLGNAIDREVTEEVSEMHKADSKDSGRYTKQLISKKFLKEIGSKISLTRREHRLLTLPWDDDARILSTTGFMHYSERMRLNRLAVEHAVSTFIEGFDSAVQEAQTRLGTMFDADDYPTAEDVKARYAIDVEIKPVPEAGDFRAELTDQSVKAIVNDIESRTEQRLKDAINDVFLRVADVTGKMVERLQAYKPGEGGPAENTFRDSLVWNVKEVAELIPMLNITADPRLDDLHQRLLADLAEHSPEILRDNDRLRQQTATKAEKILKKVKSYLA